MKRALLFFGALAGAAFACTDYEGSDAPAPTDAGSDSAPAVEAAVVAPKGLCTKSGDLIKPIRAYDASPDGGLGFSCNANAALVPDGVMAGLDRKPGADNDLEVGTINGQQVTGCVGVDFAEPTKFASLAISAGHLGSACPGGVPCDPSDAEGGCTTGGTMFVFTGTSRDAVQKTANPTLPTTISELSVPLTEAITTVVVCRASWSAHRDDVAVDSIQGVCP